MIYGAIIKVILIGIIAWAITDTIKDIQSMDDKDDFEDIY